MIKYSLIFKQISYSTRKLNYPLKEVSFIETLEISEHMNRISYRLTQVSTYISVYVNPEFAIYKYLQPLKLYTIIYSHIQSFIATTFLCKIMHLHAISKGRYFFVQLYVEKSAI